MRLVQVQTAVGVWCTVHLPVASRVQLAALKVPAPSLVQLTVPVGVLAPVPAVSLTVAVQVVEPSTGTEGGTQSTLVPLVRVATASLKLPELVACLGSPP